MSTSLSADDRRALRSYLRRFSWATRDYLQAPLRTIVGDLRRDTIATAQEVGMAAALADLGDPADLAQRYTEEHGRRGPRDARRGVRLAVAALTITAVVAAAVGLRALPRIELIGVAWTDQAFVLTPDTAEVTYIATDVGDDPASLGFVIRNPGPFTETISGVDTPVSRVGLVPSRRDGGLTQEIVDAEPQRSLTLAPGELAFVRADVSFAPCASYSALNGTGISEVTLQVSALGLRRTVVVPLDAGYWVRTTVDITAPATCEPGAAG